MRPDFSILDKMSENERKDFDNQFWQIVRKYKENAFGEDVMGNDL